MKTDIAPAAPRSPLGREKLEGQNQAAVSTVTKVQFHWNAALGINEGYDLWMGKSWIHFPGPEWRLEEAINPPITSWADKRVVNWTVTWNRPNGRPSIIDLKENEMNPDTSILDDALGRAKTESADHVPTPPEKRPRVANGAAPFIRNHFKLHYKVEGQALNAFLKTVYMGMEPEKYISANGVDAAYRVMDAYDAGQKSNGKPTDPEPQSDDARNSPNEAAHSTETKTEPTPQIETQTPIPDEKLQSEVGGVLTTDKPANVVGEIKAAEFTPSPLLGEIKTLMGIPAGQLGPVLNRPHQKDDYKRIKAKDGSAYWTDLDPYAVRQRFDKVFGPQGLGWRLVPVEGVGKVEHRLEDRVSKENREYRVHIVSYVGFQFEYALVMGDKIQYVQTSALSDSCENEDEGYAYRSAFTSLTKQALKTFGGFDHFADKAA